MSSTFKLTFAILYLQLRFHEIVFSKQQIIVLGLYHFKFIKFSKSVSLLSAALNYVTHVSSNLKQSCKN